jgi:hypothetical protein
LAITVQTTISKADLMDCKNNPAHPAMRAKSFIIFDFI